MEKIPKNEIDKRVSKFQIRLHEKDLAGAFVTRPISIYYFSGTAKASILFIPREGNPILLSGENNNRVECGSVLLETISTKIREEIPFVNELPRSLLRGSSLVRCTSRPIIDSARVSRWLAPRQQHGGSFHSRVPGRTGR